MNHNDAAKGNNGDGSFDPDATEVVTMDLEAMLHVELDALREAQKQQAASRPRIPRAATRIPPSRSAIPRMPIHTLPPPPPDDEDEAPTSFFDRASVRSSVPSIKTPSVRSVTFPAADYAAPRAPVPFAMEAPRPKVDAGESVGITPYQPFLAPTSRRPIVAPPSVNESLAPVSMGSIHPSYPPPAASTSTASLWAIVLTLTFSLASVALMGLALLKPDLIDRGKQSVAGMTAKKPKAAPATVQPPPVTPAEPPPPQTIAVPPVLFDDSVIEEVADDEAYLVFPDSARGRRLFVDGRVVGEGNDKGILVACGKHKVQLGSSGTPRVMDLPCGGGYRLAAE